MGEDVVGDEGVIKAVAENDHVAINPTNKLRRRRIRLALALIGMFCLVGAVASSWYLGSRLTAPARHPVPSVTAALRTVSIESNSGAKLAAWTLDVPNAAATVILLHPVRCDRRSMLSRAELCRRAGFSVLLLDLQAHGESEGDAITFGRREAEDVIAAVNFVRRRAPRQKIGIIGWSLGGAATLLASPLEVDAVVLELVYPTIEDAVRNRLSRHLPAGAALAPLLLAQLPLRLGIWPSELRPIDRVAKVGCPLLVLAGELDEHTTLDESNRLYRAASQPKQLHVFPGAKHEDLFAYDPETYQREVLRFLQMHLSKRAKPIVGTTNRR